MTCKDKERQQPILLSIQEAADLLSISYATMYRATKIQGFPVVGNLGHIKIVTDQLLEWINHTTYYISKVYSESFINTQITILKTL